jgi:hypothetical protein
MNSDFFAGYIFGVLVMVVSRYFIERRQRKS